MAAQTAVDVVALYGLCAYGSRANLEAASHGNGWPAAMW